MAAIPRRLARHDARRVHRAGGLVMTAVGEVYRVEVPDDGNEVRLRRRT